MKLSCVRFQNQIIFDEKSINVLIIENPGELSYFICEIIDEINGDDGDLCLSDDLNIIDFSKGVELIINPFVLNTNNKYMIGKLHSDLKKKAYDSDNYVQINEMKTALVSTINTFLMNEVQSLTFSEEVDVVGLFKLLDIKFDQSESLLENICDYITVYKEYTEVQLFVFVNLKSFLSGDEINKLYDFVLYKKIQILLIENKVYENKNNEKIKIIDSDLCEF